MASYYARNLGQICDDTLRLLGEFRGKGQNGRTFSYAEVMEAVNEAVAEMGKRSGSPKDVAIIPLQDGVNVYNLPMDCIRPLRIMVHGNSGSVLTAKSVTEVDLLRESRTAEGDPVYFFRDFLTPAQIGFFPIPSQSGSSFTRDHDHGLLRRVADADGSIPFDAGRPLRRIRGVPFERTGTGRIIRDLLSPYGNIQVWYIRACSRMESTQDYPDPGIPEFIHMYLRYGAYTRIAPFSRKPIHAAKLQKFAPMWLSAINRVKRLYAPGPVHDVRPT